MSRRYPRRFRRTRDLLWRLWALVMLIVGRAEIGLHGSLRILTRQEARQRRLERRLERRALRRAARTRNGA